MNADSFSLHNDAEDEVQDSPEKQQSPKQSTVRHDSPIFGFAQNAEPEEQRNSFSENPAFGVDKDVFDCDFNQPKELIINVTDQRTELLGKLKQIYVAIHQVADDNKAQLAEAESICRKVKYRVVFTKIQTSLHRLEQIVKASECSSLITGFNAIRAEASHRTFILKYKTETIYKDFVFKMRLLVRVLETWKKRQIRNGFRAVVMHMRSNESVQEYKQENEKIQMDFNEKLDHINREIGLSLKKIEELNGALSSIKAKESELNSIISQKEKQLKALETDKANYEVDNKKNIGNGENSNSFQQTQTQLQSENDALKERLNSSDFNVSSFIKEMNDLLDSHELSTNIGSNDNSGFFNNSNHNEAYEPGREFENGLKSKEKSKPAF